MAETLDVACDELTKSSGASSGEVAELKTDNQKLQYRVTHLKQALEESMDNNEVDKLQADNKKLLYRIEHLKRALEEK